MDGLEAEGGSLSEAAVVDLVMGPDRSDVPVGVVGCTDGVRSAPGSVVGGRVLV